jgi:hypothetical protein
MKGVRVVAVGVRTSKLPAESRSQVTQMCSQAAAWRGQGRRHGESMGDWCRHQDVAEEVTTMAVSSEDERVDISLRPCYVRVRRTTVDSGSNKSLPASFFFPTAGVRKDRSDRMDEGL